MTLHTVKAYGDELNQLTADVARMGGLAEAQIADAVESMARRDIALGEAAHAGDLGGQLVQFVAIGLDGMIGHAGGPSRSGR